MTNNQNTSGVEYTSANTVTEFVQELLKTQNAILLAQTETTYQQQYLLYFTEDNSVHIILVAHIAADFGSVTFNVQIELSNLILKRNKSGEIFKIRLNMPNNNANLKWVAPKHLNELNFIKELGNNMDYKKQLIYASHTNALSYEIEKSLLQLYENNWKLAC